MAEGARLESVFTRNRDVGSNPTLSARKQLTVHSRQLSVSQPAYQGIVRSSSMTISRAQNRLQVSKVSLKVTRVAAFP